MSLHVAGGGGGGGGGGEGGTRLSRLPLDPPLAMQIGSVMLENFKHHFDKPPQMSHN